ncbi:MAG: hypothetical protein HZB13_21510 [Acidobacteria bacterium]|nr:hypothetical protein [Acidobacteriota bacterium]
MPALKALRASAWTLFLMGLAHLAGHLTSLKEISSPSDDKMRALVAAMNGYVVPDYVDGRSFMSMYQGFSLMMAAMPLLIAALVLTSCSLLKDDPAGLRRVARMHAGGMLVLSVIAANYFILPPTIFLLVAFGLAAFALARLRKA